jgi:hypothetical protein
MDPWNPILGEVFIKREPWWGIATRFLLDVLLVVVVVWLLTVVVLSLEKGIL